VLSPHPQRNLPPGSSCTIYWILVEVLEKPVTYQFLDLDANEMRRMLTVGQHHWKPERFVFL
jgi:hypothetical protein